MATWIPWKEIKEELMQDASFREGYEEEFEEFKRQNTAELTAERAVAASIPIAHYGTIANPKPTPRPIFVRSRTRQRLRRPVASIHPVKAVEA